MSDDLVWSTDPSFQGKLPQKGAMGSSRTRTGAPGFAGPVRKHLPKGPCVSLETSGRNGKGVTLVTGLPLSGKDLEDLGKVLRQACGSGGTVKDGAVEIQGDHRDKVQAALSRQGIQVRRI
jgi:predicted translation initiation factor SUI1